MTPASAAGLVRLVVVARRAAGNDRNSIHASLRDDERLSSVKKGRDGDDDDGIERLI